MKVTKTDPSYGAAVGGGALVPGSPADGDLGGTLPAPIVEGIGGYPITGQPFASGDVLQFNGTSWVAGTITLPAIAAGDLTTRWEPMTNGVVATPEIVFAGGDVVMVEVPL